ncbi:hypothetical protein DQ226_11585 [Dietzia maris]|uniref:C-type cytochrome biogenesis protein CcsB n=1 Tax=Dietzia maris TaxID=37915 RepID=A0A365P8W9_9ACTN|nr:hypothetical protein DQ226_11585 [Dietzia maris]
MGPEAVRLRRLLGLYTCFLHTTATNGQMPQKAAWLNVASLVVLIFTLFFINFVISGLHSYASLN